MVSGLVALTSAGCTLLGSSDWSCSDAATPGYEKLQGLVKQWAGTDSLDMQLVGDSCGQKDAERFLEIVNPPEQLITKLNEVCSEKSDCSADGLTFRGSDVQPQQEGQPRIIGLVLTKS